MAAFTDDFNRADSSSLGAGWVEVSGDWSIISNRLSSGSAGGTIILRAAGAMASNDHYAQVTIAITTAASQGVWCRGNANISSGYLWRNDGTSWDLFSVVGGSFSVIGSFAGAAANGDVAKVEAVGSTIKGFVNGAERVSVTDTAVTTGTSVGLRSESTSALRFDDFAAADVVTGVTGDAAIAGTATLSATGLRAAAGSSALTATADLSTSGLRATTGTAALTPTASLTAGGTRSTSGAANLATSANLAADGTVATTGDAAMSATAALAAVGVRDTQAEAALTATGTLTAAGERAAVTESALTATATLAAAGTTAVAGNAALIVTATLTARTVGVDLDSLTAGIPRARWAAGAPCTRWTAGTPRT